MEHYCLNYLNYENGNYIHNYKVFSCFFNRQCQLFHLPIDLDNISSYYITNKLISIEFQ